MVGSYSVMPTLQNVKPTLHRRVRTGGFVVPSEHTSVPARFRETTQGISRRARGRTMNSPSRRLDSNTVPLSK